MPSNIEKLAAELNALTDYDPLALECTDAKISEVPGEHRIYLYSFDQDAVFQIDFDEVLPYDPSGGAGTTNDVFAGARISLTYTPPIGNITYPDRASADKWAAGYLKMVRFSLRDAAKTGRITSKILANTKFTKAELLDRTRKHRNAVKRSKEQKAEFLNSLSILQPVAASLRRARKSAPSARTRAKNKGRSAVERRAPKGSPRVHGFGVR
jgi:hypothetical protein